MLLKGYIWIFHLFFKTFKTILSGIFAIVLVSVAGFGINRSLSNDIRLSNLALGNIEALAQEEGEHDGGVLPPVVITCSGSGQGPCWVPDFEPLPFNRYRVTCPYFSGRMQDNCMPGTYPI